MPLIDSLIQGGVGIASGIIGHKKRVEDQKNAQAAYDTNLAKFQAMDTSNPYANMQNVYEDLTVNTQAADFQAQQQAQGMASTMDAMRGAAGGSGIAALAQSLANAQTQNAQQSSASIAQQEASNQAAQARMAGQIQNAQIEGDIWSRGQEQYKTETQLGMAQADLRNANLARQQATQDLIGGIGTVASAAFQANPAVQGAAAIEGVTSALGQLAR